MTELRGSAAPDPGDRQPEWGVVRRRFAPSRRGAFSGLLIYAVGATLVIGLVVWNGAREGRSPPLVSVGGFLTDASVLVVLTFLWGLLAKYGIEWRKPF